MQSEKESGLSFYALSIKWQFCFQAHGKRKPYPHIYMCLCGWVGIGTESGIGVVFPFKIRFHLHITENDMNSHILSPNLWVNY